MVLLFVVFLVGVAALAARRQVHFALRVRIAELAVWELRRLAAEQQRYRLRHGVHASALLELRINPPSTNLRLLEPINADSGGWTASFQEKHGRMECTIAVGTRVRVAERDAAPYCL